MTGESRQEPREPPGGRERAAGPRARRGLPGSVAGLLLALLAAVPVSGQEGDRSRGDPPSRHTILFRDVELAEALRRFAEVTRADIVYSSALVEGRRVFCRRDDATPEELLRCILTGTGLDYLRTSRGTFLLVEGAERPAAVGRLAGRVVDARTGEPVPGARVRLGERSASTATDAGGNFSLSKVLSGTHRIVVTEIGYATSVDSVRIPPDGRETVRIEVVPRVVRARPIVVDGLRPRDASSGLGEARAGVRELERLSVGGTPDALRTTVRQPGVHLRRPLAELHLQGGGEGEHVTLLDGAPVRKPVSLGRFLSAFSPQALERVTIRKAGFGARHGSYTAGVVEATHDLSRPEARVASATGDLLSANGRAQFAWGTGGTGSGQAMAAVRTSVWDAYRSPGVDDLLDRWTQVDPTLAALWIEPSGEGVGVGGRRQTSHVDFADVHGAVRQQLAPFHQLYVSGYHGSDRFGTNVASLVSGDGASRGLLTQDLYDWENTVLQARHEWLAGARVSGTFQLHGSVHEAESFFGLRDSIVAAGPGGGQPAGSTELDPRPLAPDALDHADEGNRIEEWGGRAALEVGVAPGLRVLGSVEPRWREGRVRVRNRFLGALEHGTASWEVGGHLGVEAALGERTSLEAGTRLTHLPAFGKVYPEPRVALRHDRAGTPLGDVAIRVAGGIYRQFVMQSEVSSDGPTAVVPSVQFWMPLDGSLEPPLARHLAGELAVRPAEGWNVRLEGYAKWQPRTLELDYAGLVRAPRPPGTGPGPALRPGAQSDIMVVGEGRASGLALQVEREGARIGASVTGEVADAERNYPGRFGDRFVPAPWEEPYRLAADLTARLVDGVRATGSWRGVWGRSWALRRAYYDFVALTPLSAELTGFDLDRPGRQTLDPFSRLDLGLEGDAEIAGLALELQVSAVNLLGRANEFDRALDTSGPEPRALARTLPGRRLSLLVGLRY